MAGHIMYTRRAQDGVTKSAQDLIFSFSARSKAYVHKLISFWCPKQTHNQIKQILQRFKFGSFVSKYSESRGYDGLLLNVVHLVCAQQYDRSW